jgi:hypothetical protein
METPHILLHGSKLPFGLCGHIQFAVRNIDHHIAIVYLRTINISKWHLDNVPFFDQQLRSFSQELGPYRVCRVSHILCGSVTEIVAPW